MVPEAREKEPGLGFGGFLHGVGELVDKNCTGERRGRQTEWLTPGRKERQDTLGMDSLRPLRLCVMLFQVQQIIDHYTC